MPAKMIGTLRYASHACCTEGQKQARAATGHIAIINRMQHLFMLLFDTGKPGKEGYFWSQAAGARGEVVGLGLSAPARCGDGDV